MPQLVRLYIRNVLFGFGLSIIFVGLLLWFNIANLWHLVSATSAGPVAVVMLVIFNGIVFAGVQFAIAIMRMAAPEDRPGGGRRQPLLHPARMPKPVLVLAADDPGRDHR